MKTTTKNSLERLQAYLHAAVLAAYRFDAKKDLLAQLLELNLDVARRIEEVRGRETLAERGGRRTRREPRG